MDGNYYPNSTNMSDHYNSSTFGSAYYPPEMMESEYGENHPNFEVSEFFELDDWMEEDQTFMASGYTTMQSPHDQEVINTGGTTSQHSNIVNTNNRNGRRERNGKGEKVAFKTKSEVEILDDGFKWRKYGKKMVKNSPNPRNYYRCSVEGCPVKKRVERDREDQRYVITTYEGIHNHQGPSLF
ncbi:hypothetical protein ACH5RR_039909 [Cinchona calisaya]|uniref:WRKY domain-containing protein n=1 Tax=Cinchona calisaya TaxID=153742 RepID=A0ABD2Y237_9GENT